MKTMQDNSYKPWHLKYRPSKLEDLVGQPLVSRTLAQGIQTGKIANAYLFDGSRGTGKTSTARIVAKSLNCSSPDKPTATPCGKCTNCQTIETGNNIDVLELDAASNNGVDDIREIINYSQLSPAGNRYRVFIIDECHQLSRSAQQAFLRTLESPPNNVVFILATTEREKLLNTIISRCIHLRFSQITVNDIVTRLTHICKQEKVKIAEEALYAIARHSKGGMRDAIQLLEQLATSKTSEIKAEDVQAVTGGISSEKLVLVTDSVLKGEIHRLMKLSQEFADEGIEPANLLRELLAIYRDLLLLQLSQERSLKEEKVTLTSSLSFKSLSDLLKASSINQIESGLLTLEKTEREIEFSSNDLVWMEVCLLKLANSGVS